MKREWMNGNKYKRKSVGLNKDRRGWKENGKRYILVGEEKVVIMIWEVFLF